MIRPFADPQFEQFEQFARAPRPCDLPQVGLLSDFADRPQVVPLRSGPIGVFAPPVCAGVPHDSMATPLIRDNRHTMLDRLAAFERQHVQK